MHYYQFNIGDYAKHTRHLTNNEDLAYRRMLDIYYLNEKPLFNDLKKIARLINMRGCEEDVENVLNDFFELRGDHWHNSRIEKDLAVYAEKAERARKNGKMGGRPRKEASVAPKPKKPKPKDDSQIMAIMPLAGGDGFELRESQTSKWAALYPSVDLRAEVNKMIGWLDANPSKRKTKSGITKFMNSWLSKVQDQGGRNQAVTNTTERTVVESNKFTEELDDLYNRSQAAKLEIEGMQ